MRDLTDYARKVDSARTVEEAQAALMDLIDQFQHKDKQQLFKQYATKRKTVQSLQKWAWDLVLVGNGLKVVK
jgi:predicted lipid-binding transport protein (Tim44 family)